MIALPTDSSSEILHHIHHSYMILCAVQSTLSNFGYFLCSKQSVNQLSLNKITYTLKEYKSTHIIDSGIHIWCFRIKLTSNQNATSNNLNLHNPYGTC
uniref:Uncharacterized protein n=1 Tax=Trichobilharzia regenti TaxID=157069 RepID=A0AA85IYB2_TRIRE|nr:unnamed protein product [Trichobilharzia regenti]